MDMRAHHSARAALCLIAALCLLLTGCSRSNSLRLIVLGVEREQGSYWENLIQGASVAAQDNGWALETVLYDPEAGLEGLVRHAQDESADYLALALYSAHLPSSYSEDIPLILLGADACAADASILVAGEESTIGKRTGQLCAQAIGLQKRILLLTSTPALTPDSDWEIALRGEMGPQGSQVAARLDCGDDQDRAYDLCCDLLSTMEVDGVLCDSENATLGALRAVRTLGLQVPVMGAGFDSEIALGLRDGLVRFTVVRSAYAYGYMGVENAVRLANGRYTGLETRKMLDAVYVDANNMFDENLLVFLYDLE